MATKTIACPECGAAVAPGRYACAECGALLAALGPGPRIWTAATTAADRGQSTPDAVERAAPVELAARAALAPGLRSADPELDPPVDPRLVALAGVMSSVPSSDPPKRVRRPRQARPATEGPDVAAPRPAPAVVAPDGDAVAKATDATEVPASPAAPETDDGARHAAAGIDENQPLAAHAPPPSAEPVQSSLSAILSAEPPRELDVEHPPSEGRDSAAELPPDRPPTVPPVWPPADDPGPALVPPIRTPAGAYLAPSAVLPPLDAPLSSRNGHEASQNGHVHAPEAGSRSGPDSARSGDAESKARGSLTENLEQFGITAEMPRRLVGGGAAIAGLGFLLPWINVLGGTGALLDSYLDYWGLSGPGHWILAAALLALVGAAFADGPLARVPVGAVGIAFAGILLGLLWPYLFGVEPKSVGVWIVLAGTLLMAIGGVLDLRRRHAGAEPGV